MCQQAEGTIPPVVVSNGMFAIPDSWLAAHRDFHGYISLEDAQELKDALNNAIVDEMVHRRMPWKGDR